jgi:hypothetical protein
MVTELQPSWTQRLKVGPVVLSLLLLVVFMRIFHMYAFQHAQACSYGHPRLSTHLELAPVPCMQALQPQRSWRRQWRWGGLSAPSLVTRSLLWPSRQMVTSVLLSVQPRSRYAPGCIYTLIGTCIAGLVYAMPWCGLVDVHKQVWQISGQGFNTSVLLLPVVQLAFYRVVSNSATSSEVALHTLGVSHAVD